MCSGASARTKSSVARRLSTVWPGKPNLSRGEWFSIVYLNFADDPEGVSNSTPTLFGEPYIFAGWSGVVFAFFAYGLILAFVAKNGSTAGSATLVIELLLTRTFLEVSSLAGRFENNITLRTGPSHEMARSGSSK